MSNFNFKIGDLVQVTRVHSNFTGMVLELVNYEYILGTSHYIFRCLASDGNIYGFYQDEVKEFKLSELYSVQFA